MSRLLWSGMLSYRCVGYTAAVVAYLQATGVVAGLTLPAIRRVSWRPLRNAPALRYVEVWV